MNLTKQVGLVVGAAALTLTSGSFADTTPEANTDLKAKLDSALARIDQLEAKQNDNWLTEQRADEIRGLVQDVLADADTRASLLAQGMSAGYEDGFVLSSADANFLLRINGQLQTRWVYNSSDGGLGFLNQDLVDLAYELGIGFANAEAAVRGNLSAAQTTAVGVLDAARLAEVLMPDPNFVVIEGLEDQIEAFLEAAFVGFTTVQQDATALALGIPGVTTFAGYRTFVQTETRAALATLIRATSRDDGHRSGFENTRTKLWFTGHVVNPDWQYVIEADFGSGGGHFNLLDAYIAYDYGNGWKSMVGQWKAPFLREELVDARYQLAVERSLLNSNFTGGRVQGIGVDYRGDQFHVAGAFTNGANRTNRSALAEDTEYAFTARVEYLHSGTWDQFTDFTSPSGEETGVLIGAAIHVEEEEYGTGFIDPFTFDPLTGGALTAPNNNELETLMITADVSVEFGGANLFGAFVYRNLDPSVGTELDQVGFLVQGGYYFNSDWEGFVRYEWADFDIPDLTVPGGVTVYSWDDLSVLTFGVNRYFAGHQAKWTTDIGIALDRVEFFAADARAGYRSDTGGDDGQVVIRTQLQLLF